MLHVIAALPYVMLALGCACIALALSDTDDV